MAIDSRSAVYNAATHLVKNGVFEEMPFAIQLRAAAKTATVTDKGHHVVVIQGRDLRAYKVQVNRYGGEVLGNQRVI